MAREDSFEIDAPRGAGAVLDHRVELGRGATLAGVVRDRSGHPVAGARVAAGLVSAMTDQDGNFRLADVPTGRVVVNAERAGLAGRIELGLSAGDELVTLQISLE